MTSFFLKTLFVMLSIAAVVFIMVTSTQVESLIPAGNLTGADILLQMTRDRANP